MLHTIVGEVAMTSLQRTILILGLLALAVALIWVPYRATLDFGRFAVTAPAGYEAFFSWPTNDVCAQSIIDQTQTFDFKAIKGDCQISIDATRLALTIAAIVAVTLALFLFAGRRRVQR